MSAMRYSIHACWQRAIKRFDCGHGARKLLILSSCASVLWRHARFPALLFRVHRIQHVVIETMAAVVVMRSEEHTSELQSPDHLVCRLLLEKKKRACRSPRWSTTVQRRG